MIKESILRQYFNAGATLMPLNGKIPAFKVWRERKFSEKEIINHKGNIGWVLRHNEIVIDVDPRNGGDESYNKLKTELQLELLPTVTTPRGGYHYYLKVDVIPTYIKKNLKDYPGIDFLSEGSYCLIAGCKTEHGEYTFVDDIIEFEQTQIPPALLHLISDNQNRASANGADLGDFTGLVSESSYQHVEKEKVLKMLFNLNPSMPNDEWVKVGMALHDWNTTEGLELWEMWSKGGDNYKHGETEKRWRSFELNGGVTLGTIGYMVKEVVFDESETVVNNYVQKIKTADKKTIEMEIFKNLKKESFSDINKEIIVKTIQDRFKELTGVKAPVSYIRDKINPEIAHGSFVEDGAKPKWCDNWVYVNSHNAFAEVNTLKLHKTESFNILNGAKIPTSESGAKQSAFKFIADNGYIEVVSSIAYLPNIDEKIVQIENFKVLNSFNKNSLPTEATVFTDKGLEAIESIKKHILFICGNEKNQDIFTQWLAHNVQYPGKQILWSPVIQAIQGVGKSFFGELLRVCLGDRNVGTVSPSQVVSDFNGWATNVIVNVLEELRVKGHNRYDAVNCLKPLITDKMIQINDKGVKQYMTYNTTNYICFTNYKDALPLEGDDRRWWVIFVEVDSLADMENKIGESVVTYFPKLFSAVREYGAEVRKWLLEYELSKEFLAIKQAPMTDYKLGMIATEEAGFEGLAEIKDLIEKGGKYYNKNVISSPDLFDDFLFNHPDLHIEGKKRHALLKKIGYTILPRQIKIDGKMRSIWAKKIIGNDKVRELLKLENNKE